MTVAACTGGGYSPFAEQWQSGEPSPPRGTLVSDDDERGPIRTPPAPRRPAPAPVFGATVTLDSAPPALGAASLVVSADQTTAIATDSDRDRVAVVNLATKEATIVALEAGDEPGRLTVDDANRVHVVLDRAGAVATIDLASGTVLARRPVCAAPRGIARHGSDLFVACTGGELVRLPADPLGASHLLARLDRDLRDVVVIGPDLLVSRLRTAEVLRVRRADGVVLARAARPADTNAVPSVAWRLALSGAGSAVLVHQMARTDTIHVAAPQAYGSSRTGPCDGPVLSAITSFTPTEDGLYVEKRALFSQAVAPVDVARPHLGDRWTLVAAGNGHVKEIAKVQSLSVTGAAACQTPSMDLGGSIVPIAPGVDPDGQTVALAFTADDTIVVFSREPAAIHLRASAPNSPWDTIALGGASREDTGHAIFHSNTGKGIACVSCHPGGGDDGHVWKFSGGARRTQSLEGTLEGTAPYHWGGDMPGIEDFGGDLYKKRMGGPHLDYARLEALRSFMTRLPAPRISPAVDTAAAARGKQLFESAAVGCSGCHVGTKLTNSASVDVGTGEVFQVPSLLGLGLRAPYLHDGRATTLLERFGPAGGGDKHGQTSTLTPAELADLIVHLESL